MTPDETRALADLHEEVRRLRAEECGLEAALADQRGEVERLLVETERLRDRERRLALGHPVHILVVVCLLGGLTLAVVMALAPRRCVLTLALRADASPIATRQELLALLALLQLEPDLISGNDDERQVTVEYPPRRLDREDRARLQAWLDRLIGSRTRAPLPAVELEGLGSGRRVPLRLISHGPAVRKDPNTELPGQSSNCFWQLDAELGPESRARDPGDSDPLRDFEGRLLARDPAAEWLAERLFIQRRDLGPFHPPDPEAKAVFFPLDDRSPDEVEARPCRQVVFGASTRIVTDVFFPRLARSVESYRIENLR